MGIEEEGRHKSVVSAGMGSVSPSGMSLSQGPLCRWEPAGPAGRCHQLGWRLEAAAGQGRPGRPVPCSSDRNREEGHIPPKKPLPRRACSTGSAEGVCTFLSDTKRGEKGEETHMLKEGPGKKTR